MTRFDSWEAVIRPPEDYLMHWGIKGMKHGRNRYQNPDGTWTEAGLERRRQREGFGESRKERKLAKKVAKAEKKEARKAAREEAKVERAEIQRKKKLSGLTDEELKERLARAKMEQEYREIKRKGSALETGSKLIGKYLDYKENKEKRTLEMNRQRLEMERLKTQQIQAKENTKQSKNQIKVEKNKAKEMGNEAKKMREDRKAGLKTKRKAELQDAKTRYKAETRGAIRTWLKNQANKGKEQRERQHELEKTKYQLAEQREKRANAEAVAKSNAEQARYKVDQEKYKSNQESHKAIQSVNEKRWREIQAQTEYEKEKKRKPT